MIYDDFKNFKLYGIDKKITDFILNMNDEIELGRHVISDYAYVNVQEYDTRDEVKLEAHKNHIDIQFLLKGKEKVYTTSLDELEISEEYDPKADVAFYKTPKRNLNVSYLEEKKFILLYPDDAHSPCMKIDNAEHVKKAIVKIAINQ